MTMTPTVATAIVLAQAATTAGYAPSVHNTQPWHWTVLPDRLELTAQRDRQLAAIDPEGRLLLISCGAALNHARLALAAEGWRCTVDRLPDPARPDLLAVLTPTGHRAATADAMRFVQSMEVRHTDRRPLSERPLPREVLQALAEAARAEGAYLHVLTAEQVYDLAAAADRAAAVEAADEGMQQELAYWTSRRDGLGVPQYTLPAEQPATTVPERDFGRAGTLPTAPGHDRAASYGLLYGDADEPLWWLRAGEALSAVWLTAIGLGASVLPLSSVIEVATTRAALRHLVADLGWPYVVLRLGYADPDQPGPMHPPRLTAAQVVDTSAVRHLLDDA
ncbi:Acg family FMN-binding oxidoreductase [Krasilnikovia sp. M28-CT-15]|uniref:Acg family FMN-binding oxidoreductase n=1 Tax=Krasilnikovia sp. M28-CT-15 TaxID=3373540 RepID=UPI0038767C7F